MNINVGGRNSRIFAYKNLQHLNLSRCKPIKDEFITDIVNNLKNLKYLNLSWCDMARNLALEKLGQLENLKEIFINKTWKFLCVTCNISVSDIGIIKVLDNSRHLEHLEVHYTIITTNTLSHASHVIIYREQKFSICCNKRIIKAFSNGNEISPFLNVIFFFNLYHKEN